MKQKVLFVSIFDLTIFMHAIAVKLEHRGIEVLWLTTSEKWTEWLLAKGVPDSKILKLIYKSGEKVAANDRERIINEIVATERSCDLNLNQVLLMDQFVARRKYSDVYEVVLLYFRDIKKFIEEKSINIIFSEATNTNEIITYMISKSMGVQFLAPADMRYPLGRVIFFDGYTQNRSIGKNPAHNGPRGHNLIQDFKERQSVPYYFSINSKSPFELKWFVKAIKNRIKGLKYTNNNMTHHDLKGRIALTFSRAKNRFILKHQFKYVDIDNKSGRIAYYGLQVQPEASIDVQGSFHSDQVKLIKDIRRALPFDVTLLVKDHPNFLGTRKIAENREIAKLSGVELVHHDVSSFDIYKRCSIVFTVSGTTAYESGLLGIPAIVFAPMFFEGLSSIFYCPDELKLKPLVDSILSGFKQDLKSDYIFIDELIEKSFKGNWSNPITAPNIMEPENLENIAIAFETVITQVVSGYEPKNCKERIDEGH